MVIAGPAGVTANVDIFYYYDDDCCGAAPAACSSKVHDTV